MRFRRPDFFVRDGAGVLTAIALIASATTAAAASIRILVQSSPLAGSQYYAVGEVWPALRVGDRLELVREAGNRHDANAVRVLWQGRALGYVPRRENRAVAAALDAGEKLEARVTKLRQTDDPWQRVEFDVYLVL